LDLFDLVAKITLDSSDYEKGLDDSQKKASSFSSNLKKGLQTAGNVSVAAIGTITTATTALTGALVKGAGETAVYGDNIDKMSQKMGISAEAYQEWDAILQHSGSSIDAMSKGMLTLQKKAADNADAFEKLGLSQEQVASMSTEDLFAATIAGLQKMDEGAERTALASDLLGGAVKELGPLLNTSAEDTEAMRKRVHELGGVMSNEAVSAAAKYQDSLQDMQTAFSGIKRNLTSEFLPGITTVMDGLTAIFSGDAGSGIGMITEGISGLVTSISERLPELVSIGSEIINALLTAITENLPTIFNAGTEMVMQLLTGVIENLPTIVAAGLDVLTSLYQGIADNLPVLIPAALDALMQIIDTLTNPEAVTNLIDAALQIMTSLMEGLLEAIPVFLEAVPTIIQNLVSAILGNIPLIINTGVQLLISLVQNLPTIISTIISVMPEIISNVISALLENLPLIIDAGVQLFVALIENLPTIIAQIVEAIPEIIAAIVDGFLGMIGDIIDVGRQIVEGIWEGIKGAAEWIKQKVKSFFDGILGGVKKFLGISSPSKVFAGIGENMAAGIGVGWEDEFDDIKDDINDSLDFEDKDIDLGVSTHGSGSGGGGGFGSGGYVNAPANVVIQVYASDGMDIDALAEKIQQKFMVWERQRQGGFA